MRRPAVLVVLAALPLTACADRDPSSPAVSPTAGFSTAPLLDGANGGNPRFFFLPPLAGNPNVEGEFNPDLRPVVEVCALSTVGGCADPQPAGFPIRFTSEGSGRDVIRVNERAELYNVLFRTNGFPLDVAVDYRIRVFAVAGGEEIGHIDVDIVGRGGTGRSNADLIRVEQGRTLPIRFRVEQGVACTFGIDCAEVVLDSEGGTVTSPAEFAGVQIPEGALDGPVLIIVERIDVSSGPCLPASVPQAEGCYRFDTQPALSEVQESGLDEFNVDVVVGVCIDPEVLAAPEHHQYALHKFDPEQPALGVLQLPSASVAFLDCEGFTALALDDGGAFGRLARAGWQHLAPLARLLGPGRAHAINLGFGGLSKSFSNIGWARGLDITVLAGDDQAGPIGTTLPVDPTVRVTATHWDPDEFESAPTVEGVEVTFRFTDPAGNVTVVTDLTNESGLASVPWVLGGTAGTNTLSVDGATAGGPTLSAQGLADLFAVARVDDAPDGSGTPTFPTVAEAYAHVVPGGTILVAPGVHAVSGFVIDHPITIAAEESEVAVAAATLDGGDVFAGAVIDGGEDATAFAFNVAGVPAGRVLFRGLTFRNGAGGIRASGAVDHVVVESCTFFTPTGISAEVSASPNALLTVQNSTFSGGAAGVSAAGIRLDVRNSEFRELSVSGIVLVGAGGSIADNELFDCAHCIRFDDAAGDITDNTIIGTAAPADASNPQAYALRSGIEVSSPAGAVVTVSRNTIANAQQGIATHLGAVVAGRDNIITTTYQALVAADNSSLAIRFSDVVGAFIGVTGPSTLDVTCNYWGGGAPPNVSTAIPTTSYTPWSPVPIAGTGTTSCEQIG